LETSLGCIATPYFKTAKKKKKTGSVAQVIGHKKESDKQLSYSLVTWNVSVHECILTLSLVYWGSVQVLNPGQWPSVTFM
jgi:hypothetical protein